uniref:EOG090X0EEU n=1 Tax=Scapholeberis mucronata TaxID=202097 RepID=A0A4Y7NP37_9CRUS|nr:EOG090X0EEU [Scapholeberis mucronata]SVE93905.1 EOG090X0EEU [Scapholeberis mucronata]
MSDASMLVFLAVVMLIGSFLAGSVPLIVTLSEERLNLVSILGAGLLVGTALAVIVPEGTQMLYAQEFEELKQKYEHHKATEVTGTGAHEDHNEGSLHSVIGLALLLGFVFMLLIDQIESGNSRNSRSLQATIGLVVHAAADGIALGAAATSSHAATEMIVFLAIMLHKAPASFGLVTFLLHDGLDRVRIRRYLLIFSLAAPLAALATFFGLSQKSKETLSSVNATGFAMLFSAGTFLYVSTVHVLPEIVMRSGGHSHLPPSDGVEKIGFTRCELLALISGALLPLALTAFHHH